MSAYYNEIDPFCAQWLRNLIEAGHIAPGDVDDRSIEDVMPDDLAGYSQCHFFAGIGIWSYSLRRAGWADDRPAWSGSCPCQPFSAAGKGAGFADERHLWPAWFHLIGERRPPVVFGEQVGGRNGLAWLDLVQADLEGLDYACGASVAPAAGFGAPHIRERTYWVAYADGGNAGPERKQRGGEQRLVAQDSCTGGVAYARRPVHERVRGPGEARSAASAPEREAQERERGRAASGSGGSFGGLARSEDTEREWLGAVQDRAQGRSANSSGLGHSESERRERRPDDGDNGRRQCALGQASEAERVEYAESDGRQQRRSESSGGVIGGCCPGGLDDSAGAQRPGPTNGFWRVADWLFCTDGKWRPVEPGAFPLVDGTPARVGRLRAYGNAICAPQAQAFIEAAMQVAP